MDPMKKQAMLTSGFEFPTLSKMNENEITNLNSTLTRDTSLSSEAQGVFDSKAQDVKRMCYVTK